MVSVNSMKLVIQFDVRIITYLSTSMILQTINPTVSDTIAELFLLSVQYVLEKIQEQYYFINSLRLRNEHNGEVDTNLWQIWILIVIKCIAHYPFLYPFKIRPYLSKLSLISRGD